ncbi:MAG: N-acetyltransferase [Acidobacteria bacterium]|nr:N-acetyltransferase [Acidobacteriota bacterium]
MKLRDYRPADLESISCIEQKCFPAAVASSRETLQRMLSGSASAIVAETPGGELGGFVVYRKVNRVTGSLLTLDVLPEHRRRGLGGRLVSAAKERLAEMGVEKIRLRVSTDNAAAQVMYERLDFRRVRRDQAFYQDGSDAWVLETMPWAWSLNPAAVWTRMRERLRHFRVTGRLRRFQERDQS